ncbi:regulatory protein [Streptomyces sp. LBL]|uniref:recombination regulator RecX n=1 Tax=Streptomyces sp. LBL TaxID=2940562 RepID=UPI0024738537|nr:recombination regulator RecX [Streptomyces sp. LBL]MDH6629606.1 regulatory protein [Streptomyces sp. LBL]
MTRRTDWAEYTYPDAPRERGGRGTRGSTGPRDVSPARGMDEDHVRAASYGMRGSYDAEAGGEQGNGRWTDGPEDGSDRLDAWEYGPGDGSAFDADSSVGSSPPRGGARGAGGSRGRRRRGRAEPSGEDGGSSFSSRAEKEEPSADPVERARAICLRLLTGTPRTRKQLADALRKREIPDDAAEEVLSRFEDVGLINDSAFADAWVESRHHGRGLARRALAQELRTKGVDSTLIDAAMAQLDSEQEEATAAELVARKLRATRGLDRDKRLRRLAGMLARKGYPEGMALRVVRQALEEEGEQTEFIEDDGF